MLMISITKESHHVLYTTKSTTFAVSQDQWDTKEDTGKFMKNALRTAVCQNAPLGLKRC